MEEVLRKFSLSLTEAEMILVCTVLFALLIRGLGKWFFAPYLALVEAREALTSGAQTSARDMVEQADALEAQFDQKLFETRAALISEKITTVNQVRERAKQIVERAEAEAAKELEEGRARISGESAEIRAAAKRDSNALVETILQKVLAPKPVGAVH